MPSAVAVRSANVSNPYERDATATLITASAASANARTAASAPNLSTGPHNSGSINEWLEGDSARLIELPSKAVDHWDAVAKTALNLYRERPTDLAL